MLIPREKPYQDNLNSYYLNIDKFTEHLQGDIGSGCIYCRSSTQENLIYFNEQEIIRGVVQESGQHARVSLDLESLLESVRQKSFMVTVYYLDAMAVYFWGQLPPFKRAKKTYSSQELTLSVLLDRFASKKFSGFIDLQLASSKESTLLFFNEGNRLGGSYSWGYGGLSKKQEYYDTLLAKLEQEDATLAIGRFLENERHQEEVRPPVKNEVPEQNVPAEDPVVVIRAMEEFLGLFVSVLKKHRKRDPLILLRQNFIKNVDRYSFLDPFVGQFTYLDGIVEITDKARLVPIVEAVIDCVWEIVHEESVEEEFRAELSKWNNDVLKKIGIFNDRLSTAFTALGEGK